MDTIRKNSKSYGNMWEFKENLTSENEELVIKNDKLTSLYNQQPKRRYCKICHGTKRRYEFHGRGTTFFCCNQCGHINGSYEDTEEYCKVMYESEDGIFGGYYEDSDKETFLRRMKTIYMPKAEFMIEVLEKSGAFPKKLSYVDIGAGSGHFVWALKDLGLNAVGIEADLHQVNYVNKLFGSEIEKHCPSKNVIDYLSRTKTDVVSAIYAFEHIINVVDVFEAINDNPNIKWIYYSVPMFSVTSMLDSVNSDVYGRVLHAAHTHIYTEESIKWINQKYHWKVLGEWRFGSDIADILRMIMVKAERNGDVLYAQECKRRLSGLIDELQSVLDRNDCCSDTHILLEKEDV